MGWQGIIKGPLGRVPGQDSSTDRVSGLGWQGLIEGPLGMVPGQGISPWLY